ncbi:hypothetical protein ZWY2020_019187 [Hordeum vulgare]|nr:hypothetical protein ZWY2020_019187 [Hordeum vulgare]
MSPEAKGGAISEAANGALPLVARELIGESSPAAHRSLGVESVQLTGAASNSAKGGEISEVANGALSLVVGEPIGGTYPATHGSVESDQLGAASSISEDGIYRDTRRSWTVLFVDTSSEEHVQRSGSIKLHQVSRWITLRDEKYDILAGRYLQDEEAPTIGQIMDIDGFKIIVKDRHEAHQVSTDLISSSPQFGGRFWVLADQESEDEVEEIDVEVFERSTAAAFAACFENASRQQVKVTSRGPKKAVLKHTVRPWIGPLPAVQLAPITLSDFLPAARWCLAKGRKKKNLAGPKVVPTTMTEPSSTRSDHREAFFKSVTEAAGFVFEPAKVNSIGYTAQEESPVDKSKSDCVCSGYKAQVTATLTKHNPERSISHHGNSTACTRTPEPRVPRHQHRGFPSLGSGRAARVPPPPSTVVSMAGRGNAKPPPTAQPRTAGQGDRPNAKQPVDAHMARPPRAAQAGRQLGLLGQVGEPTDRRPQQRNRWGSEGSNASGEGQF